MLKRKMTSLLLIALLVVSGCMKPAGDYCDIAQPIRFKRDVAVAVVAGDRETAQVIDAHNRYGEDVCGW